MNQLIDLYFLLILILEVADLVWSIDDLLILVVLVHVLMLNDRMLLNIIDIKDCAI